MGLGTDALIVRFRSKFRPKRRLTVATSEWEPPMYTTTDWYCTIALNEIQWNILTLKPSYQCPDY